MNCWQTLRVTLREALEFNRREAKAAAGPGYEEDSGLRRMKRRQLLKHLRESGCDLLDREGGKHLMVAQSRCSTEGHQYRGMSR